MDLLVGTEAGVYDLDGRVVADGVDVAHLTHHGDDWWAVGSSDLYRSGRKVAAAPSDATLNCVAVTEHTVWVGADSARLYLLTGDELVEEPSFAEAPDREKWYTPWGGPPDVRSMSAGPAGILYVNVHVGGILRFDDSGPTPTLDIDSDVHQVVAHPERVDLVVAATARGLAVTHNGHDFEFFRNGLDSTYCRAVAVDGDTVLISSSRGPRGGNARLHRGAVDGGALETCSDLGTFDGNIDTHCVAVDAGTWFVGHGSAVYASSDRGDTWEKTVDGLPSINCLG